MPESIGTITILHGQATAEGPEGIRPLALNSPVFAGEFISTASDGSLEITFSDGSLLAQSQNSRVSLDEYVYNPDAGAGEITLNLVEGTFRSVTGQIVDMNPEGFHIETPSTTIGIRGTTTGHFIPPAGQLEQHAVIDFDNKPVVFTSLGGGPPRIIAQDGMGLTAGMTGLGLVINTPLEFLTYLNQLSPGALQNTPPKGAPPAPQEENEKNEEADDAEGNEGTGDNDNQNPDPSQMQAMLQLSLLSPPALLPPPSNPLAVATQASLGVLNLVQTGPLAVPPQAQDPIDQFEETIPQFIVNTKDFSSFTIPLHITLQNHYWEESGNDYPANRVHISPNIKHVIGSRTEPNTIEGDAQNNMLTGGNASDDLNGGHGDDTIFSSASDDLISGGDSGTDYVSYANQTAKVSVDLDAGTATKTADSSTDTLSNIHGIFGSNFDDTLVGSNDIDHLYGNDGGDKLTGGLGADILSGGTGSDTFYYNAANEFGDTILDFDDTDIIKVKGSGAGINITDANEGTGWDYVTDPADMTSLPAFYMDTTTDGNHVLYFDPDGSAVSAGLEVVANLGDATVDATDIHIIDV